jgi:hypothetical protein
MGVHSRQQPHNNRTDNNHNNHSNESTTTTANHDNTQQHHTRNYRNRYVNNLTGMPCNMHPSSALFGLGYVAAVALLHRKIIFIIIAVAFPS